MPAGNPQPNEMWTYPPSGARVQVVFVEDGVVHFNLDDALSSSSERLENFVVNFQYNEEAVAVEHPLAPVMHTALRESRIAVSDAIQHALSAGFDRTSYVLHDMAARLNDRANVIERDETPSPENRPTTLLERFQFIVDDILAAVVLRGGQEERARLSTPTIEGFRRTQGYDNPEDLRTATPPVGTPARMLLDAAQRMVQRAVELEHERLRQVYVQNRYQPAPPEAERQLSYRRQQAMLESFIRMYGWYEPIAPGTVYASSEPEFVGRMSIRQELTVLPADPPSEALDFSRMQIIPRVGDARGIGETPLEIHAGDARGPVDPEYEAYLERVRNREEADLLRNQIGVDPLDSIPREQVLPPSMRGGMTPPNANGDSFALGTYADAAGTFADPTGTYAERPGPFTDAFRSTIRRVSVGLIENPPTPVPETDAQREAREARQRERMNWITGRPNEAAQRSEAIQRLAATMVQPPPHQTGDYPRSYYDSLILTTDLPLPGDPLQQARIAQQNEQAAREDAQLVERLEAITPGGAVPGGQVFVNADTGYLMVSGRPIPPPLSGPRMPLEPIRPLKPKTAWDHLLDPDPEESDTG
jgi:hypothetical protein